MVPALHTAAPTRLTVLHAPTPRLAVFDTSVLTTDVIAATRREHPSSFVAAMDAGTVRGFITRRVWAEVPRVLEDRYHEGGIAFDLEAARRLWWFTYIPLLYTVDTDGLPYTTEAKQLAREDPSDVDTLLLHAALGPAALVASDGDLRRSGFAHEDWVQLRSAVGRVGTAEQAARTAVQLTALGIEGAARSVAAMARRAGSRPVAAAVLAALLVGGAAVNRRAHPKRPSRLTAFARDVCQALVAGAAEVDDRYRRGQKVWAEAERGSTGQAWLHHVARMLAASPAPATRTEILTASPGFPGLNYSERMYNLYVLLRTYPLFCEIQPYRWHVGRTAVGATLLH